MQVFPERFLKNVGSSSIEKNVVHCIIKLQDVDGKEKSMLYLMIAAVVFTLDFGIKHHIDKKFRIKEQHICKKNKIILEKYYNDGAALGFLAKKPGLMKGIHTIMIVVVGVFFYILLRTPGKELAKTGMALLLGGGANNLYDRYAKGHVVDYFRINMGPKRLKRIIFNISDFCVFIGALLAAVGAGQNSNL